MPIITSNSNSSRASCQNAVGASCRKAAADANHTKRVPTEGSTQNSKTCNKQYLQKHTMRPPFWKPFLASFFRHSSFKVSEHAFFHKSPIFCQFQQASTFHAHRTTTKSAISSCAMVTKAHSVHCMNPSPKEILCPKPK